MPSLENLTDIVQDLVESDPYTRRRIAQAVLKGGDRGFTEQQEQAEGEDCPRESEEPQIQTTQYLNRLKEIFNQVEQGYIAAQEQHLQVQGFVANLHSLFQIYRNLLSLNERELIEVLMNEHYWRTTFGALEYDPEVWIVAEGQTHEDISTIRSPTYPGSE